MATKTFTNRLADSKSPYLLQHAHNPVDWFPWCEEALEKALAENKPILVSIGYASCHWCHVMAHESFENEETARLMNEKFICIKIDREERPDLDDMFVNVVQMLTGASGWPLTIFLTPDLRPYYGGTYFPPDDTNGRPAFRRVLEHTAKIYAEHPGELTSLGNEVMGEFEKLVKGPDKPAEKISGELINETINQLEHGFDATWGGFGSPPKFPPTGALDLLMRHWRKTNNAYRLQIALTTLDQMAYGGIYDQLGGGFHRYSTDRRWLVPHFEKMLYDNALNAMSYIDAFRITKKPLYHRIAKQTLDYVLRELRDPAGGFHSSQDADTEGVEGKYYVWTKDEIEKTLGAADAKLFCKFYGVTGAGNFENHTNVLNVPHTLEEFAKEVNMPESELMLQLDTMRQKLFHERATRTAPEKDDKVLCDWNALMISALCRGGQVFNDERYTRAAIQCADLLLTTMRPAGKLCHAYHHGAAHIPAFLEDYAFLLQATVDLYESTFDYKWVMCARSVAIEMIKKLWDESAGGFFITQFDEESHVPRQKSAHDQAVPSGNAIAAHALLRLARLTDNKPYRDKATKTLLLFLPVASEFPTGFTRFLCAVDFALGPDRDVIVAGAPADPRTRALVEVVRHEYQPESVFALIDPAAPESEDVENTIPLLKSKGLIEGKPTVHICENFSCRTKILSPEPLRKYLSKPPTP